MIFLLVGRQVLQQRNLAQSRNPVQRGGINLLEQPAKNAHFAFAQSDVLIEFLLSDNWLLNSANGTLSSRI